MSVEPQKPTAVECRFAVYCPAGESGNDLHVVKEIHHFEDGTTKPVLRHISNYKRPFYITKKGKQNFKDFKEWMPFEDLDRYECTQSRLTSSIAKAIGKPYFQGSLKDLCATPYIFGADITSTSIIKQQYRDKFPELQTPYSNAVFDTETDMVKGTGEIIMATLSNKSDVLTVVSKEFLAGFADPIGLIRSAAKKYIGDTLEARKVNLVIKLVDTEIEIVKAIFDHAHETKPDFVSIWNAEFDIDKCVAACQKFEVDPADIFSDPSVPKEFRHFKFKKGPAKKQMASGRILNFKPAQRWHSLSVPASFFVIDAMQAYKQVRTGAPEESSYSLDSILAKEFKGKLQKLKFAEADKYKGAEWHVFMQKHYQIEYVVYNIFDCIGMELLDEKTLDLQLSLPMFAGCTDFANFNSLPRKSMNELHWVCRDMGLVPGCTASEMTDENDEFSTGISGWIVMLPSHLVSDNGLKIIKENPDVRTNIRIGVAD